MLLNLVVTGLSLVVTIAILWWQGDVRTILSDTAVYQKVMMEINLLDPQSPEEFWRDWNHAMDLAARHPTVIHYDFREILDHLTTRPHHAGGRTPAVMAPKPWATDHLKVEAWQAYGWAGMSGYFNRIDYMRWSKEYLDAYGTWNFRPYVFWLKLLGSLVTGGGILWFGLLYFTFRYLIILLSSLLLTGKVVPTTAPPISEQTLVVQHVASGGSVSHHCPTVSVDAVPTPQMGWLVVMAMLLAVVIRDLRPVFRALTTMSSRAPPRKERAVLRAIVVCLALLFAPVISSAAVKETIYTNLGTWSCGTGACVTWITENGRLTTLPSAFLNGSSFEGFATYNLASGDWTFAPGLALGTMNTHTGGLITTYGGLHLGTGWSSKRLALSATGSSRWSRTARVLDLVVADLTWKTAPIDFGLSYEPDRAMGPWDHRLALHASHEYKHFRLIGEVRESLGDHHLTMNVDISVPLK